MALPVFPTLPGISYPVKRSPVWSTVKADALSGKRSRTPLWTYPLWRYDIPFEFLYSDDTEQQLQTLMGFFNSVQGAYGLFAFDDPDDDAVSGQEFGQGDGVTSSFQLVRSLGGYTEPVFLLNGTPTISVAGTDTAPQSISSYGVVTFSAPPASGAQLTWTGNYYWPCRFDDDTQEFEKFLQSLWSAKSIKFSTEKLP